jgi:GNAT superfamily N-acetyltransferase
MVQEIRLAPSEMDTPPAQALITALNAELDLRYPEEGANHFRLDPAEVAPGRGAFLLALVGSEVVGCGAVRLLDGGDAELKRMFVRPEYRGRGYSRSILNALEAEARALGATRLVLETGERQPEALGLYRRAGFVAIEPVWRVRRLRVEPVYG